MGHRRRKASFERYRWCENDFYEELNYNKTISEKELIGQIEKISSILKEHGFDTVSEQYDIIKAKINSRFVGLKAAFV